MIHSDVFKSKRDKMVMSGVKFERTVASFINSSFDCSILLNRQFLSPRIHKSIECDLLVITSKKIYCVECKNYKGYIAGDMFEPYWRFASSGKRGNVQNPYLLNKKRIRAIRGGFYRRGLTPPSIESFIVVPDKCHINVELCVNVINIYSLLEIIRIDNSTLPVKFNVPNLERFLCKISSVREIKG